MVVVVRTRVVEPCAVLFQHLQRSARMDSCFVFQDRRADGENGVNLWTQDAFVENKIYDASKRLQIRVGHAQVRISTRCPLTSRKRLWLVDWVKVSNF